MIEEYGHIPDAFLLNPEETEELRTNKRYLTAQATQKIRKLKAQQQTQELLNAAHRVSDGGVIHLLVLTKSGVWKNVLMTS